jgi:transcriptional regulator with XRE-family HTH domain
MEFKDIIKDYRQEFNLTQSELGDKLSMSANAIGNYEQGYRQPDIQTLCAIADIFNISLDQLVGRDFEKVIPKDYAFAVEFAKNEKISPEALKRIIIHCKQIAEDLNK